MVAVNPPECVREATEQYLHDQDLISRWVEDTECKVGRAYYDSGEWAVRNL